MLRKSILAIALGASFALPLYAQSNSTPQAASAGNSDQNVNPVSGQLGNQGNDRPVGNAGGNRGNRGNRDEGSTADSTTPNPGADRRPPPPRQPSMDGSGPQMDQARPPRRDRDDNPPGPRGGPGTNWENPPGPQGGPGTSPDRRPPTPREPGMTGAGPQGAQGRPPRRDRDDNPPGPRGGPGTNWENPPGPQGGPGASPDRSVRGGPSGGMGQGGPRGR